MHFCPHGIVYFLSHFKPLSAILTMNHDVNSHRKYSSQTFASFVCVISAFPRIPSWFVPLRKKDVKIYESAGIDSATTTFSWKSFTTLTVLFYHINERFGFFFQTTHLVLLPHFFLVHHHYVSTFDTDTAYRLSANLFHFLQFSVTNSPLITSIASPHISEVFKSTFFTNPFFTHVVSPFLLSLPIGQTHDMLSHPHLHIHRRMGHNTHSAHLH